MTRDDFNAYLIEKIRQADESKIAKQLHQHTNVNMGLYSKIEHHMEIAKKLIIN
jgi:hypothetical protein